jgi:hypothetical protein
MKNIEKQRLNKREREIQFEIRYQKVMIDTYDLICELNELYDYYYDIEDYLKDTIDLLSNLLNEFLNHLQRKAYYDIRMIEFRVEFFKKEIERLKRKVYEQIKDNSK